MGENKNLLPDLGLELHGVSSAAKPIASWTSRDILQECREACAGHGYLKRNYSFNKYKIQMFKH